MVHAGLFQLCGRNSRGLYRLCNKGVDIVKFLFCNLNVHSAQNVDGLRHRFPVKYGVIVDFQIQIFIQSLYRLRRPALQKGGIDLIVAVLIADVQIRIAVNGSHPYLSCGPVQVADNIDVGIISLAYGAVPAVQSEHGNGPVALHLLLLFL